MIKFAIPNKIITTNILKRCHSRIFLSHNAQIMIIPKTRSIVFESEGKKRLNIHSFAIINHLNNIDLTRPRITDSAFSRPAPDSAVRTPRAFSRSQIVVAIS